MSSVYKRVLLGLDHDAQGEGNKFGALWVLLSALDSVDTRDDTYGNAATEVKYRLSVFKNNKWMTDTVTPWLTTLENKLAQQ